MPGEKPDIPPDLETERLLRPHRIALAHIGDPQLRAQTTQALLDRIDVYKTQNMRLRTEINERAETVTKHPTLRDGKLTPAQELKLYNLDREWDRRENIAQTRLSQDLRSIIHTARQERFRPTSLSQRAEAVGKDLRSNTALRARENAADIRAHPDKSKVKERGHER